MHEHQTSIRLGQTQKRTGSLSATCTKGAVLVADLEYMQRDCLHKICICFPILAISAFSPKGSTPTFWAPLIMSGGLAGKSLKPVLSHGCISMHTTASQDSS